jgi:hypothetical protein
VHTRADLAIVRERHAEPIWLPIADLRSEFLPDWALLRSELSSQIPARIVPRALTAKGLRAAIPFKGEVILGRCSVRRWEGQRMELKGIGDEWSAFDFARSVSMGSEAEEELDPFSTSLPDSSRDPFGLAGSSDVGDEQNEGSPASSASDRQHEKNESVEYGPDSCDDDDGDDDGDDDDDGGDDDDGDDDDDDDDDGCDGDDDDDDDDGDDDS